VQDFAPWLQGSEEAHPDDCRVLASGPGQAPLWQQLTAFAGQGTVRRGIVSGAFFDANLAFLERLHSELAPQELIVGIDPASVQIPAAKQLPGVVFVNASRFGCPEKEDKQTGYLHAKALWLDREDGASILAVGSANPSAPAWLAPGMSQNVEMMIARKGSEARIAAEELGLPAVAAMPPLQEGDWQEIRRNWERSTATEASDPAAHVLIALAADGGIRFNVPDNGLPASLECTIVRAGTTDHDRATARLGEGGYTLILDELKQVSLLQFRIADRDYTALVQHVRQIEGLSRTTAQRKFSEALSSLTTGMPNLEHFVDCIRDIIKISDAAVVKQKGVAGGGTRDKDKPDAPAEGSELSIDLAEVERQEQLRKQRIRTTEELGYLLDVLLYHLRDESPHGLEDSLEERDALGRSEEEQVDADDDEEPSPPSSATAEARELPAGRVPLEVCHRKVGDLVNAACDKLETLKQGKLELPQLVVILAGILSALRLLRGLDGKVPWIGAGQMAVPT